MSENQRNRSRNRRSRVTRGAVSKTQVRDMIRSTLTGTSENKFFTFAVVPTLAVIGGGSWPILASLVEGDAFNQRNGRQIRLSKLLFHYTATLPTAAITGSIRFMVYQDTMNTGVQPTTLDVLNSATVTSQLNPVNQMNNRFRVLYDRVHAMVAGGSDQQIQYHHEVLKYSPRVGFNGAVNAVTSLGVNAVFVLVMSDISINAPSYAFDFGVRYYDH